MATAAGFYFGAVATTVIALVALVALRRLRPLLRRRLGTETLSLKLRLAPDASLRTLLAELRRRALQVEGLESRTLDDGSELLTLDVRGPASLDVGSILSQLSQLPDVARIDRAALHAFDIAPDEELWSPTSDSPRLRLRARKRARANRERDPRLPSVTSDVAPPTDSQVPPRRT
jgi:acetolactate synthase regulatory subunit